MAKNNKSAPGWETSPGIALKVDADFDLASVDRAATPGWTGTKQEAEAFMAERGALLSELQERFFANSKNSDNRKVLVIVQGLDTAGKGGIARHVLGMVDPQGVQLASFGVPSPVERAHHYLWRIKQKLPAPGRIGLFDRSHYEDVLVVRVDKLVEEDVWSKRYDEINRFEKRLVDDGFTIIKVALMVSHKVQGARLAERLARPDKRWKFNPNDVDTRLRWDDYQAAYQTVFDKTSTSYAPWHIVPADNKWYARLAVTELITQALIDLKQEWPKPRWQLEVQKRRLLETMSAEDVQEVNDVLEGKVEEAAEAHAEYIALVQAADAAGDADSGDRIEGSAVPDAEAPAEPEAPSEPEKAEKADKPAKKSDKKDKGGKKDKAEKAEKADKPAKEAKPKKDKKADKPKKKSKKK